MPQYSILRQIRALILDMDGVIWRGPQPIGDTPAIFARFRSLRLGVTLATNNATSSTAQFLQRFLSLGIQLEPWQVVNSAQATAHYLKLRYPSGGPVYVVGEEGLIGTLQEANFTVGEKDVLAVVVGMDRSITYEKLKIASRFVRSGVPFIATNPDPTYPSTDGLVPGAGTMVAAVQAASGVEPIVIGKPSPEMYRLALKRLDTQPSQTLVVGDRLTTDIAGAQALGCPTALVLSGVTDITEAQAWSPQPDIIAEDLTELVGFIEREKKEIREKG